MSKWRNLLIILSKVQCSQYWPLIYTKYIINECCSTIGLIIGTIFYIICTYTYLPYIGIHCEYLQWQLSYNKDVFLRSFLSDTCTEGTYSNGKLKAFCDKLTRTRLGYIPAWKAFCDILTQTDIFPWEAVCKYTLKNLLKYFNCTDISQLDSLCDILIKYIFQWEAFFEILTL